MNAYELADKLETDKWDEATIVLSIDAGIKMLRKQADLIAKLEFENKAFRKELFNIGSMRSCSYAAQNHGFVSPRQAGDDAREYISEILNKARAKEGE